MPYVITTCPFYSPAVRASDITRTAVATLDDAREAAHQLAGAAGPWVKVRPFVWDAKGLPETGGTIGPLPDGTVIEVESVDWIELANRAILNDSRRFDNAAILAAFNLSHSQAPAAA